ncbi:MAG TPA: threonine/serine exporter family protein [Gemmatimonadales bacterium]|nr:threonine/serine exporter family protein [Gemmatimonadales bacterium]
MENTHLAPDRDRDAVSFLLSAARALHAYGTAVHVLEDVLARMAARLGVEARWLATPTSIMVSVGPPDHERIHLLRTDIGEQDLGRLAEVSAVSNQVLSGALSPRQGVERLDAIQLSPPPYSRGLTVLAFAASSAAASRFLGGNLRELAVASVVGLLIGLVAVGTTRLPALARVFEPLAGFIASAIATLAAVMIGPMSVYIATLAGIIILIPGLMLTVAMTELSSRHLVAGTSRLAGAFVTFLLLALGVALGGRLGSAVFGTPLIAEPAALPAWTEAVALLVAPLGFTVLLKAEPRDAVWILIAGILAFVAGRIGAAALGPELGVFIGALIVGLAGSAYSALLRRPAAITRVPGILLLVPGSIGFRSLTALLERETVAGVETAFRMILMAAALAAGLVLAAAVTPSTEN